MKLVAPHLKSIRTKFAILGLGLFTVLLSGCLHKVRHETSKYVAFSGSSEAYTAGVKLRNLRIGFMEELCPSQNLTNPDWLKYLEHKYGRQKKYAVEVSFERGFVRQLDDYFNAELLVISKVQHRAFPPVKTVIHHDEDVYIDRNKPPYVLSTQSIYPRVPYDRESSFRVRTKLIDLDEGYENELDTFLDAFDLIEKYSKIALGYIMPVAVVEGIKSIAASDSNDEELNEIIMEMVPTLLYQSDTKLDELGELGGAWRDESGLCKNLAAVDVLNLDETPTKTFIIINDYKGTVDNLRYVNGTLCLNQGPKETGCHQEYHDSSYVMIRMSAIPVDIDTTTADEFLMRQKDHNEEYEKKIQEIGIVGESSLWAIHER